MVLGSNGKYNFHQKLNGTESQMDPVQEVAIELFRFSGEKGSVQWVPLEISWRIVSV